MQVLTMGYHILQDMETICNQPKGIGGRILLLTHTPMQLWLEHETVTTQPGDAVVLPKNAPLHFQAVREMLMYDWVEFDADTDIEFFRSLQIPENVLLRCADTDFLCTLLRQLCAEFYAGNPKRADMTDSLLKALFIRIAETAAPAGAATMQGGDPHYAALVRLREKIYANPQEKWTVEMLCSEVNMSRSYFQLVYRETFGMTCIADVINCKMHRARELLTATAYTISHIAQLCGYDNEEHFMRQFKKNHGVTPTVYRREHRVCTN